MCVRYGYLGAHKDGGYAELVEAPAANVLPLPDTISFEAGAALPLAMLTSWHALVAQAELRPGQTVLVQAAGSGVGSAAIQIARLCGARVMTTVGSDDKIEFARALGAEHVVNYRTPGLRRGGEAWTGKRGVDVVVEHIGGETFERSVYALTRLGTLVTIGSHDTHWGRLDLRHVYSKNLRILGTNLGSILELRPILDYVVDGTPAPGRRPRVPAGGRAGRRPARAGPEEQGQGPARPVTLARLLERAALRRPTADGGRRRRAPSHVRGARGAGRRARRAGFQASASAGATACSSRSRTAWSTCSRTGRSR